ncbi:MAG: radical SAM protein [Planctomycetes bacterium]|nr:radical SAM protein [Planctomycetota bacterium]
MNAEKVIQEVRQDHCHLIELCYTCDNNCIACPPQGRNGMLAFSEIKGYLDKNLRAGQFVSITGGEPTLHPDFIRVADYANRLGGQVRLFTHGRSFRSEEFARLALETCIRSVVIPLHGSNHAIHDDYTGVPGSFAETVAGIKNLFALKDRGYPLEIMLKILLGKMTAKYLSEIIRFIDHEFPRPDMLCIEPLSMPDITSANRDKTSITFTEAQPCLADAVKTAVALKQNIFLQYLPVCIFPAPEDYYPFIFRLPYTTKTIYGAERYWENRPADFSFVKSVFCRECQANDLCFGVWISYARLIGLDELKPIRTLRRPHWLVGQLGRRRNYESVNERESPDGNI